MLIISKLKILQHCWEEISQGLLEQVGKKEEHSAKKKLISVEHISVFIFCKISKLNEPILEQRGCFEFYSSFAKSNPKPVPIYS